MPSKTKNLKQLNHLLKTAYKPNIDDIRFVISLYEKGDIKQYRTAENAVVALAFPSASTPNKVSELYHKATGLKTPAAVITKAKLNYTLKTRAARTTRRTS